MGRHRAVLASGQRDNAYKFSMYAINTSKTKMMGFSVKFKIFRKTSK